MIMADVLTWFLIIVGTYLVLVSHWLASFALFPNIVEACRRRYGRPIVPTLVGLVVLIPFSVLGIVASRAVVKPGLGAIFKGLLMTPMLLALLGSSGLALRIGAGLNAPSDEGQTWRRVFRGGVVLAPTFLLPLLGWFVVLPFVLVSGLGAALLSLKVRPQAPNLSIPTEASTKP